MVSDSTYFPEIYVIQSKKKNRIQYKNFLNTHDCSTAYLGEGSNKKFYVEYFRYCPVRF